jgi:hypothetical protein
MRSTEREISVTRRPIALHRPDPTVHHRPLKDLPVQTLRPVAAIRVSTRVPRAYPEPIRWSATTFPSPSPLVCLSKCHPNRWYLRIPPDRIPSNLCCVSARGPLNPKSCWSTVLSSSWCLDIPARLDRLRRHRGPLLLRFFSRVALQSDLAAKYELLTARSSECVGMTRRMKRISIDERRAAGGYRKVAMRSDQGPRRVTTDDTSRVE